MKSPIVTIAAIAAAHILMLLGVLFQRAEVAAVGVVLAGIGGYLLGCSSIVLRPLNLAPENSSPDSPQFSWEEMLQMLPVVVSDLKHHADIERQLVTNSNLRRDIYRHVIRSLYQESTFLHHEKEPGDGSRQGCFIKGYVRDVWDYLGDAYDLIHSVDLVQAYYTETPAQNRTSQ